MKRHEKVLAWFNDSQYDNVDLSKYELWGDPRTGAMLNFIATECMNDSEVYLEIGTFGGGSLNATLLNNNRKAIVIDPLDADTPRGKLIDIWKNNVEAVRDRVKLYQERCEKVDVDQISNVGLFYYDGCHDSGHTYEGLKKFSKCLADKAIIVVDDINIYGGRQQNIFPNHILDIEAPVRSDLSRWLDENPEAELLFNTDWQYGQAVIYYDRKN